MGRYTATREKDFSLGEKEHNVKSSQIISLGGKLPYYLELPTGKILDVLLELFQNSSSLPKNRKEARSKINHWLYNRTRPGCYVELGKKLHLAYGHQKDGRGTQHYWRLFFDDLYKNQIEIAVNSSAIVISKNQTSQQQNNHAQSAYPGLKEWGGMYFRSEAEICLAEELSHQGILFFANVRGMMNTASAPLAHTQATGRLEVDFLVFHLGKCLSIEVDGIHHQETGQIKRDYARDRLLLSQQIPTARFTAEECYQQTDLVVAEIVNFFTH